METIRDCNGNPINYVDPSGHTAITWELFLAAGGEIAVSNSWNPAGWVVGGIVVLGGTYYIVDSLNHPKKRAKIRLKPPKTKAKAIANPQPGPAPRSAPKSNSMAISNHYTPGMNIYNSKATDPDPFGRAGQKKQGREVKSKARQNGNWQNNSNNRRPKKPKKHTPGKDHRRY